ncbi:MAG: response regulator [Desulfuromonadaceae bacterium]|nr:response regulator [Desulfuromonadaceae bacterium]
MNKRARILIVDDDPTNISVLEKTLCEEYEVCIAENGYDALRLTKELHPDLILLDIMMPDLDGFDVCRIIKAEETFADIPIIFLTALDTIADELMGLKLGGLDYLTRPIDLDLLKLRVRNHMALKERNNLIKEQRDQLAQQKHELDAALALVKQLEGIIPICMHCKKIRDDKQSWHQLEQYISDHSEAKFSHGICPACAEERMAEIRSMATT